MRISVGGSNREALEAPATAAHALLCDPAGNAANFAAPTQREFQLRELTVTNRDDADDALLEVRDAPDGAEDPAVGTLRMNVHVPSDSTVTVQFAEGQGPRFTTGVAGSLAGGAGDVQAGDVFVSGDLV